MDKNSFNEKNFSLQLNQNMKKKMQCSVLTLLQDYLELCNKELWFQDMEEPDVIRQIRLCIMDSIGQLPSILHLNSDERKKFIEPFMEHKSEIQKISLEILAYYERIFFLERSSAYYTKQSLLKENPDAEFSFATLADFCFDFFAESSNGAEERYRMANILSCFPVRMTREKYSEYVQKSIELLTQMLGGTLEQDNLLYLEFVCNPSHSKFNFGCFHEIKEQLDEIDETNLETMGEETREQINDELCDIKAMLTKLDASMTILLESINALITISTFSIDMDYLFDDSFIYKDLYFTIKETLDANAHDMNYELFGEALESKIEEQLSILVDEIQASDKQCQKLIEKLDFDSLDDASRGIYKTFIIINTLYFERSNDLEFCLYATPAYGNTEDNETTDSEQENDEKITTFLSFIKESIAGKAPKKQRLVKQFFLAELASPYTPEQFSEYIYYCYDASPSLRQLIISDISETLTVNGFDLHHPSHDGHGHHHHDEDCDCGHEHHHH